MRESEWARSVPSNMQHARDRPRPVVWPFAVSGVLLAVAVSIPIVVHIFVGGVH